MSALRVARGATGRDKILKFEGCYHGHADSLLVKAGSGLAGESAADSAGVPAQIADLTLVTQLDDEAGYLETLKRHGREIAAVIIEPMPANYGLLLQRPEFLRTVVEEARKVGALVIFDEVISGFRAAWGGMVERSGLRPDLVTYGKIIGGGLAVGAYAGRGDLMDQVSPAGRVYQAGTLSANPLAMRTGLATLQKLRSGVHTLLESRTADFTARLSVILKPLELTVSSLASVFWIHPVSARAPRSLRDLPSGMAERYQGLFHALLNKNVYLAPSAFEVGFISLAHTPEVLNEALQKIEEAVRELR